MKELVKAEKNKTKKGKTAKATVEDTFQPDLHDPRFEAIYDSHHFGLDPSDSRFKKTKAMKSFVDERQRLQATKRAEKEPTAKHSSGKETNVRTSFFPIHLIATTS